MISFANRATQLQFDFAAPQRLLSTDDLLRALARRGCRRFE
jgi:hypothetical protein